MQSATLTRRKVHAIGKLCVGGDWACAHGDLSALRDVALKLAASVAEPLHCYLVQLAEACYYDPFRAVELWNRLKDQVYESASLAFSR